MQRLTITLSSRDHTHHHLLTTEILSRARRSHIAGATAIYKPDDPGRSGIVHRQHLFTDDGPVSILIIDEQAKIQQFQNDIRDIVGDALVVIDDVTAFRA